MKIVYASRTGNVASLIDKLGVEATRIDSGEEKIDEDFLLFTYTDGYGDIPVEVDSFLLENHKHLKGVICSGDSSYGEAFCGAGDKIADIYSVPCLYKVEMDGSQEDVEKIQKIISEE